MKFLPGRRIAALAIVATFTAVLAMLACTHAESPDPEAAQHIASTPSPSVTATAREGDLAQSSTEPRADVQVAPEGQGDRRGVAQESLRLSASALDAVDSRSTSSGAITAAGPAPETVAPAESGRSRRAERIAISGESTYTYPNAFNVFNLVPSSPSTGGVNPVNGQQHDAMFFQHHGTNPFVDADIDSQLTFGLDVDTASYTMARRFLMEGTLPPQAAVRVEEFVNYFDWDIAPPEEEDFAIHVDGAPSRYRGDAYQLLRVSIRGREIAAVDRASANFTFVIDTSGSMARENRLELVKRSLRLLVEQLDAGDQVAIVEYGSQARVVLPPTPVRACGEVLAAVESLQTNGSTNAEAGLTVGYDIASHMFDSRRTNRVILCTDGVANVGETGADGILARLRREARDGITLTALGFGMDNYNDVLLERLADEGDGMFAYVDTLAEARRVLVENLSGTLEIIAREARAQIEFNPEAVRSYRLLGYENRDIADERFRDDTVDAGEIGAGHRVTALVEVRLWPDSESNDLGTVHLRWGEPNRDRFHEIAQPITWRDLAPSFDRADASLRLAACVAETAEVLRGSVWAKDRDLGEVLADAREAVADLRVDDTEMLEFLNVLARARDLQDRGVAPGAGG